MQISLFQTARRTALHETTAPDTTLATLRVGKKCVSLAGTAWTVSRTVFPETTL